MPSERSLITLRRPQPLYIASDALRARVKKVISEGPPVVAAASIVEATNTSESRAAWCKTSRANCPVERSRRRDGYSDLAGRHLAHHQA